MPLAFYTPQSGNVSYVLTNSKSEIIKEGMHSASQGGEELVNMNLVVSVDEEITATLGDESSDKLYCFWFCTF